MQLDGMSPKADVIAFAKTHLVDVDGNLKPNVDGSVVVGHLPFMQLLAGWLMLSDSVGGHIFTNSGCITLTLKEGHKKWMLEDVLKVSELSESGVRNVDAKQYTENKHLEA